MRPGGGALEHADRVHQTHERASLDDPRAAAFGDAGNALSVPEVGVHPSAGIEEPHPQEARGALGVFLVVAEVVGERQCADGAAQRAPAGASRGTDGATPRQRSTSAARRGNTSVLPRRAGTRPPQSRTARSRPPAPRYRGASVSPTRSCRTHGTRFSRGPRSGGAPGPRPCRSARSAALPWSPLAPSPSSGCAGYSAPAAARDRKSVV